MEAANEDMPMTKSYIIDMDGVLMKGAVPIEGAADFLASLRAAGASFLVLTNNSIYTPRDLNARLAAAGLDVPVDSIFTSALATASFLDEQRPGGSAFVIGEAGLTTALHDVGYILTETNPGYVVLGETKAYSFERLTTALRLVAGGARFIATNRDVSGPAEGGLVPACGAVAAMITAATGVEPFFVGKPNPLMMRAALRQLDAHSGETIMIGDRMDTDIIAGIEAGMETVLVLSGVTARAEVDRYPYRPTHVIDSIADLKVEMPA